MPHPCCLHRLLRAVLAGLLVLFLAGCTPEMWGMMAQATAEGLGGSTAPSWGGSSDAERISVCAKYMTASGWSQPYRVSATIVKGAELNTRTGTYNYQPYSTYAVIFWAEGEASILELEYYYGGLSAYGLDATDQQGRKWHVAQSSICY